MQHGADGEVARLLGHAFLLGHEIADDHLCQAAQDTGDNAAEEQLTGGNAADTGNDHHGDGRRNDDADGGGNGGNGNGKVLGVALADHFRHEHAGNTSGIGNSGTGDARKDHAGKHVHVSQTAVDVADDGVAEVHQALGNTALGHGEAGKGVQGNSQQCKAVHALKHALGNGDGAAAAQEQDAADGGQAQTHGDGHAQKQQNKE